MNEIDFFRPSSDIYFTMREYDDSYNENVIRQIEKAWRKGSGVDRFGHVWVDTNFFHTILRTDKSNARYIIAQIDEREKRVINGTIYIHGPEVLKLLDSERMYSSTIKRSKNLAVSRDTYLAIEDSDSVSFMRAEYMEDMNEERKKLKGRRISRYGIDFDELTGEELKSNCQFSHIRSWTRYPRYALDIDNGLIVNNSTHKIITSCGVNDEEELFDLCQDENWDISWYDKYKRKFGNL